MSNNSVVGFEDLPAGRALLCSTDNINSSASWISPVGHITTTVFTVSSGTSVLQMERTTSPIQSIHSGMWHCEIPDRYNTIQYIYVGLYSQGNMQWEGKVNWIGWGKVYQGLGGIQPAGAGCA